MRRFLVHIELRPHIMSLGGRCIPLSPHTHPTHSYPGLEPGRASLLARAARHDCKKRVCVLALVVLAAALITNMCVPWPRLLHVLDYWVLSAVLLLTGTPAQSRA
jgi:hypothetical protein